QEVKQAVVVLALAALLGCQSVRQAEGPSASAQLQPTTGNTTSGSASFTQVGDKVHLVANVTGLTPGQEHGFHIHEAGDCGSGDGMSAKGHFNPYGKPHGSPASAERHAGDMPALRADAGGNARIDTTLDVMSVKRTGKRRRPRPHRPCKPRRLQDPAHRQRRRAPRLWSDQPRL